MTNGTQVQQGIQRIRGDTGGDVCGDFERAIRECLHCNTLLHSQRLHLLGLCLSFSDAIVEFTNAALSASLRPAGVSTADLHLGLEKTRRDHQLTVLPTAHRVQILIREVQAVLLFFLVKEAFQNRLRPSRSFSIFLTKRCGRQGCRRASARHGGRCSLHASCLDIEALDSWKSSRWYTSCLSS